MASLLSVCRNWLKGLFRALTACFTGDTSDVQEPNLIQAGTNHQVYGTMGRSFLEDWSAVILKPLDHHDFRRAKPKAQGLTIDVFGKSLPHSTLRLSAEDVNLSSESLAEATADYRRMAACWEVVKSPKPMVPTDFGVEWEAVICAYRSLSPKWTFKPDVGSLCELLEEYGDCRGKSIQPEFFCEGSCNKLYQLQNGRESLLLRVSMPLYPYYKTASEVATINFIRTHTTIPVPPVKEFSADMTNPMGLEYIVMRRMPGGSLEDQWDNLSMTAKERVFQQLAEYVFELFSIRFSTIGSLLPINSAGLPSQEPGRVVTKDFFWNRRWAMEVPRGPFNSVLEWMKALMTLNRLENHEDIEHAENSLDEDAEYELEEAENTRDTLDRLEELLPRLFPTAEAEPTTLTHPDIHLGNILVDETGNISGIVDWECISTVPVWGSCYLPKCLSREERHEEPDPERYARNEDGTINSLYYDHLKDYETTHLREIFLTRMQELSPEWMGIHLRPSPKIDFYDAMSLQWTLQTDTLNWVPKIIEWLDEGSRGEAPCLGYV